MQGEGAVEDLKSTVFICFLYIFTLCGKMDVLSLAEVDCLCENFRGENR